MVSKPQNVQLGANTLKIRKYTTVAGDTVTSLAQKNTISPQTIRWANNLTSDALEPGRELTIPPLDGVLYTVKSGDTIDSIVAKYKADKAVVVAVNSLEFGLSVGSQLIIANGELPATEQPGYIAPRVTYGYASNIAASVGNRYAWGNCTWYAYERRVQLGSPVGSFWGNASTWGYNARLSGFRVDGSPEPGAVMANGGGAGHVAVVESVNSGVSVRVTEMNAYRCGGGFNRISTCDISWSEATSGMYNYIH